MPTPNRQIRTVPVRPGQAGGGLGTFERYLWVALCTVAGVGLGKALPHAIAGLRGISSSLGELQHHREC